MHCGRDDRDGVPSRWGSNLGSAAGLRAALMGGAAVATLVAMLGPAVAFGEGRGLFGGAYQQQWQPSRDPPRQHAPAHRKGTTEQQTKKKEPPPKALALPLIEISISDQKLTLYDRGEEIARAPVSTGMAGHLTP